MPFETETQPATESQLEATQSEINALQAQVDQACLRLRQLTIRQADELRQAKTQIAKETLQVYTEGEAAKLLRISESGLRKLRNERDLPHFRAGDRVLYANTHLLEIVERLSVRGLDLVESLQPRRINAA
ncbi:MAG: helix-turn-helix domain-containing protein [Acidobacteriota bacterium]|nr:helix-turn-helix domain-containing protein [Acidobacteriota bacterium]